MSQSVPAFRAKLLGTLLCTLTALACGPATEPGAPEGQPPLTDSTSPVVYGTDDRKDVYDYPDGALKDRARQSTVALMAASDIVTTNPNNVTFNAPTLGSYENLCSDQRFRSDPTPAFCSGTLIDDDLVLTAGHCVEDMADCASMRFVFKFYRTAAGTLETVTTQDIFSCKSIVARHLSEETEDTYIDFTIVKLDRKATPRFTPAPVRKSSAPLTNGQNVAVIGSGSGIPFKIDSGGSVRDNNEAFMDYFVATTDTFAGNSGSGVYETATNTLAGILVFGDEDYVKRSGASCYIVNTCAENACQGEGSIYVHHAIAELCARNTNERLCGTTPPPEPKYTFTAANTASASRNTVNGTVALQAGQKLTVGTCGVEGAAFTGDTFLRVRGPAGTEVASNDDACGGTGSKVTYTATVAGTYEIRAGCYQNTSCSGTVVWEVAFGNPATEGTFAFNVSDTNNATRNTANGNVTLTAGATLSFGSTGVTGASGTGDTVVRLYNAAGQQVMFNDDAGGTLLSHATYTVPAGAGGTYQIRMGCAGASACSGTAAWSIAN